MTNIRSIARVSYAIVVLTFFTFLTANNANSAKSLTIQSSSNSDTETLMLPDDAQLDIDVTSEGIVLTIPNVNLSVKCLALASAPNTCTLTAGGGVATNDDDSDGVPNVNDQCPGTAPGSLTGSSGCSIDQQDSDNDGVENGSDKCANTAAGASVNADGCSDAQLGPGDSDNDGINDDVDRCPSIAGVAANDGCPPDQGPDTSEYCGNPQPGATVVCSKSLNLDSIYENTSLANYEFPGRRVLSLPFSTADKTGETDVFGSFKLVTDEAALPAILGGPRIKIWYSLNPAGPALSGAGCLTYLQEATTNYRWTQQVDGYNCPVASLSQARIVYFNIAVACRLGETGCTTSTEYPNHNGYTFRLTKYYQE